MASLLSQVGQGGQGESLNNKLIVYEPTALREMRSHLQHDQRLRQLSFGTLDKIRRLGLNNKPTKDRLHLREHLHQYGANLTNLINIKKSGYKMDSKIIFCHMQHTIPKVQGITSKSTNHRLCLRLHSTNRDLA